MRTHDARQLRSVQNRSVAGSTTNQPRYPDCSSGKASDDATDRADSATALSETRRGEGDAGHFGAKAEPLATTWHLHKLAAGDLREGHNDG